jgi:hypothetical protein
MQNLKLFRVENATLGSWSDHEGARQRCMGWVLGNEVQVKAHAEEVFISGCWRVLT